MVEVLDARPISNLELVVGRFLGILIPSWIPLVVLILVFQVVGLGGRALGLPLVPLEGGSMIALLFLMAIPACALVLAAVFLVSLLVRHRLVAAIVLIGLLVAAFWSSFRVPIYLLPLLDLTGAFSFPFPSDILANEIDLYGTLQRLGLLIAALGLLGLAAAVHPRRDDGSRPVRAAGGVAVLALGLVLIGSVSFVYKGVLNQIEEWSAVHAERKDEPVPDLETIQGEVIVEPGRSMALDLNLGFRAPEDHSLDRALFTLNPGLEVASVRGGTGETLEFEQHDGLLDVALGSPLPAGEETSISLIAEGEPNVFFAYLDAVRQPLGLSATDGALLILGFDNILFKKRFVALMPGGRWLPAAGPEAGRGDPATRPVDFFSIDLTVELPEGWLAAGPGKRREASGAPDGRVRFRFAPPAHVPEAALMAGRFETRSLEVDGVHLEVMVHPSHAGNLEIFQDAEGEIRDWVSERLQDAADLGLPYPYDGFTLVDVPMGLRGFAGGWRMDTTLAPPTMLLIRESGLPTANFTFPFRKPENFSDREGGVGRAKRERLERFFENDFGGGNLFLGAARNFFLYQTSARGAAGLPFDFVCETLASDLVTGKDGYFSAHLYSPDMGPAIQAVIARGVTGGGGESGGAFTRAIYDAVVSRPEVWEMVLDVSLSDLDPWVDPGKSLDVLTLKGSAMAWSMRDGLGRERSGRLLGALRERFAGQTFDRQGIVEVGETVGEDLGDLLSVWLDETALPGLIVEDPRYYRLQDAGDGSARYQVRFTIRNDENADGLFRVETVSGRGPDRLQEMTDPIEVSRRSATEVGVVRSRPPDAVRVVPYLALNRRPFSVMLPPLDEEKIVREEALDGTRPAEWNPPDQNVVVVDDLDPGFSVEGTEDRAWWRLGGGGSDDEETDGGLPLYRAGRAPSAWSRTSVDGAWGKYRHTMAVVRAGEGEKRAIFAADIPRAGTWELEMHAPSSERRRRLMEAPRGTWHLVIEDDSGRYEATWDADKAETGWNVLDSYELAGGEVRVSLSDKSDGRIVFADAIRWTPVRSSTVASVNEGP
jgi:hypothetical protein